MNQVRQTPKLKALLTGAILILLCSSAWAQQTVTGKIVSATSNEPLIGATVLEKGTNNGVTTDANGNYSIKVDNPAKAVLVVSYLSFVKQEVDVAGRSVINIEMSDESRQLDEVVVIGYGTVKKKDLTGSVTSIKSSEIASVKAANPLEALQGKATGIDMTRTSGRAGAAININLRGNRSLLASNEPLVLVDGVEYGSNIDINPSDIESVDVLKDASSTAIYGTRGANGVIIITTKKGGQGKSRVSFSTYASYNTPSFIPKIMNTSQFVQKRFETLVNDSVKKVYDLHAAAYNSTTGAVTWNQALYPDPWNEFGKISLQDIMNVRHVTNPYMLITNDPTALSLLDQGTSLDYLDMIFQNSYSQNYELSVTGGDQKTSFSFSLGYMDDRGLLRNDQMRRFNVKVGADHQLFKRVKVGANILLTNKKNLKRDAGIFNQSLKTGTVGILYNDDGTYKQYPDQEFTKNQPNPMLDEAPGANLNDSTTNRMFGTGYVSWEIVKGLVFKSNLGVDLSTNRNGNYIGPTALRRIALGTAQTQMQNQGTWSYTWDNTLNLQKTMGNHDIQALLGSSTLAYELENYQFTGIDQQTASTQFYDWNNFTNLTSASNYQKRTMVSFFGRLNYKFMEKYLLTGSLRADASSVLAQGKKNKWDYFPSVALGWRMKEETALKGVDWLSNLKLRLSWGQSGNAAISPYQTITELSKTPAYYSFDDKTYAQNIPYKLGEPTLTWEKTQTWDVGVDFGFLNERVRGGIDLYLANTDRLLLPVDLPGSDAYTQITMNAGSTRNKGIEIVLSTVNLKTRSFEWSTDWNFSANKDEVTALYTGTEQTVYQNNRIYRVGSPTSAFYDYKKDGVYQISDLQAEYDYVRTQLAAGAAIDRGRIPMISNKFVPGDIKLEDKNGDGIFNDADKEIYNRSPRFTFGFNNNISLDGFGLSVMVFGRIGQDLQYGFYQSYKPADLIVENGPYVNAWTPNNPGADFPAYYTTGNAKSYIPSMTYVDGSFVKVKDITFSYSFPKKFLNSIRLANLKLYATGRNLFVWSKIKNYDPEVGGSLNFPLAKQYIVGLNLDF